MSNAGRQASDVHTFDLGRRSSWVWLTVGIGLLGLAEAVAVAAMLNAVFPTTVAIALDLVILIPTLGLLVAVGSALTARVTVDAEQLTLRFGLLGGAQVPRARVAGAEHYVASALRPVRLGFEVPIGSQQLTASRGGPTMFVRVLLDRPVCIRVAVWRTTGARELVLGTDSPDQLIAALT